MEDDSIPNSMSYGEITPEEKQWALFVHLSALIAMWLGGLAILGPLIIWLVKKDQSQFIDDQGKEAVNFHLNILIAGLLLGLLAVPLTLLTVGIALLLIIPVAIALFAASIVMPILAAMKANQGEAYRYPFVVKILS
ncbi:MAG: DUF4870 domain-containing protein [Planctomycetes bacterium]|nr:DUF4870 domain-containing protein [Planctomycetota bacterium]